MISTETVVLLVRLAGAGQALVAGASFAVPRVLRWREELAGLRPLNRQVFWTYAGYILAFNASFAALSLLAPRWILDGTPLATAVATFIGLYWAARLVVQFAYYDVRDVPCGLRYRVAHWAFAALFLFFVVAYAAATLVDLRT